MAIPKRLRKPLIPALVALIALGVWAEIWYSRQTPEQQQSGAPSPQPGSVGEAVSLPRTSPPPAKVTASPTNTPPLPPPDEEAMLESDKVSLMIRDYRTIAGENPVGTNAEIMEAIMGKNPKGAKLGPPEGMQLNENGELIDRWGTPYFFHQLSRDQMEIRSAGADKVMWTEDDAVVK
ncbi:MAG TPA: hypothetical protein VG095_08670 [Chthoniobacterales bacterium]|nr:hypothetical protein [Chthoniobacterales bacterium]